MASKENTKIPETTASKTSDVEKSLATASPTAEKNSASPDKSSQSKTPTEKSLDQKNAAPETNGIIEEQFGTPKHQSINDIQVDAANEETAAQDAVLKQIAKYNLSINKLKNEIQILQQSSKLSHVDENKLQCLKTALQKEMQALDLIIQSTIDKQSKNQTQKWDAIPLSTTLEEDLMPHVMFYASDKSSPQKYMSKKKRNSTSSSEENDLIQQDIKYRDMMIDCLQQKIRCLKSEMIKICSLAHHPPICNSKSPYARVQQKICCPVSAASHLHAQAESTSCMKQKLDHMTHVLNELQIELCCLQKERVELGKYRGISEQNLKTFKCPAMPEKELPPPLSCADKCEELDEMKNQHNILLTEYAKKDREVQYLKEKVENLSQHKGKSADNVDKVQIDMLKERIQELKDEEEEFKIILGDQQLQINEYREKYLQAQQLVVEQRAQMENLEINKAQIAEQIQAEALRIKSRFQDKLRELSTLPKILENEQFKLQTAQQANDDLITQLSSLNSELKKAQKDLKKLSANGTLIGEGVDVKKLSAELQNQKKITEATEMEKNDLAKQLKLIQEDMEDVRREQSRQLIRAKERADASKEVMQQRINQLEIELAESRARSAITLAEREEVIDRMREQLNDISGNFTEAQKQIRNLKKRLAAINDSTN